MLAEVPMRLHGALVMLLFFPKCIRLMLRVMRSNVLVHHAWSCLNGFALL